MSTIYKNNPNFTFMISGKSADFYMATDASQYHMSRFLAASANDRYARLGLTEDVLTAIEDNILKATEEKKWDEIAVWVHNLKSRRQNPVDEFAALRMAAIYTFIDGEDADKCESVWTDKKFQMIKDEPELFSFFLSIGLQYTPSYKEFLSSISQNSLEQRKKILSTLTPIHH